MEEVKWPFFRRVVDNQGAKRERGIGRQGPVRRSQVVPGLEITIATIGTIARMAFRSGSVRGRGVVYSRRRGHGKSGKRGFNDTPSTIYEESEEENEMISSTNPAKPVMTITKTGNTAPASTFLFCSDLIPDTVLKDKSNVVKPLQRIRRSPSVGSSTTAEEATRPQRPSHQLSYAEICEEVLREAFPGRKSARLEEARQVNNAGNLDKSAKALTTAAVPKRSQSSPSVNADFNKPRSRQYSEKATNKRVTKPPSPEPLPQEEKQSNATLQIVKPYLNVEATQNPSINGRNIKVEHSSPVFDFTN